MKIKLYSDDGTYLGCAIVENAAVLATSIELSDPMWEQLELDLANGLNEGVLNDGTIWEVA
jgi:hypothetical protein